ncbi:MAG: hypothetical protein KBA66_08795 [Leptospiraceae bacterium]|nr:hypothetical protein [Leptospiraceae bacterium]
MSDQNSFFQKPILKILTLLFAFSALTVSILFSQSNSQNKKEKEEKKEELIIHPSSKSMGPTFPKKEKPEPSKETNVNKEQTNSNPAKEIQQVNEEPKQKEKKEEPKTKKKKKYPVMPSSKAPDPGNYE